MFLHFPRKPTHVVLKFMFIRQTKIQTNKFWTIWYNSGNIIRFYKKKKEEVTIIFLLELADIKIVDTIIIQEKSVNPIQKQCNVIFYLYTIIRNIREASGFSCSTVIYNASVSLISLLMVVLTDVPRESVIWYVILYRYGWTSFKLVSNTLSTSDCVGILGRYSWRLMTSTMLMTFSPSFSPTFSLQIWRSCSLARFTTFTLMLQTSQGMHSSEKGQRDFFFW